MKNSKALFAGAAIAGLMSGSLATQAKADGVNSTQITQPGVALQGIASSDSNSCKGKNTCKGKGGCKSGDNGCKGKNSCKGKGGAPAPTPAA